MNTRVASVSPVSPWQQYPHQTPIFDRTGGCPTYRGLNVETYGTPPFCAWPPHAIHNCNALLLMLCAHVRGRPRAGSFLAPLNSYRIEGEDDGFPRVSQPAPSREEPQPIHEHQPIHGEPHPTLERQRSTEVTNFVEGAFDEMDVALRAQRDAAHHHHHHHSRPTASSVHPSHYYRLSGEEQAWLDQEFDAEMEMAEDHFSGEEASRTGSIDDRADEWEEETEEEFVRDLLVAHPALNEAEARWLWQERERARRG